MARARDLVGGASQEAEPVDRLLSVELKPLGTAPVRRLSLDRGPIPHEAEYGGPASKRSAHAVKTRRAVTAPSARMSVGPQRQRPVVGSRLAGL